MSVCCFSFFFGRRFEDVQAKAREGSHIDPSHFVQPSREYECMWCVVCGVWCVVCGVWCVVCGVWCGV